MKNIFKFETFRKRISVLIVLIILTSISDYVDTIPETLNEIIAKDIMLITMFFLCCLLLDVIKEIRKIYGETKSKGKILQYAIFAIILAILIITDIYAILI